MAKKRQRKSVSAEGGAKYRKAQDLVGTLVYWSKDERARAKAAAALAGFDSLQDFCRATLTDKATDLLKSQGLNGIPK